jgi:hypothetical protein
MQVHSNLSNSSNNSSTHELTVAAEWVAAQPRLVSRRNCANMPQVRSTSNPISALKNSLEPCHTPMHTSIPKECVHERCNTLLARQRAQMNQNKSLLRPTMLLLLLLAMYQRNTNQHMVHNACPPLPPAMHSFRPHTPAAANVHISQLQQTIWCVGGPPTTLLLQPQPQPHPSPVTLSHVTILDITK